MKTPDDGDHPDIGLGKKIATQPPKENDERHWKAIDGRPAYQRHAVTGEVRETPAPLPPMSIYEFFGMARP